MELLGLFNCTPVMTIHILSRKSEQSEAEQFAAFVNIVRENIHYSKTE